MDVLQQVTKIPDATLRHTVVLRQNPPAPVNFTATATTQTTTLFGIPANHVVVGVFVRLVTTFVAFGMSSCSVTLGGTSISDSNITSANFYAPSFVCTQAVSNSSFLYWTPFATYTTDPQNIKATFTSVGAQLAAITAGEIEFTIHYRPL